MKCPNTTISEIKQKFDKLVSAVGEPMAYFLYDKNGGNFLDKDVNGNDSQLYKDLLQLTYGDEIQAIILKSQIYGSKFVNSKPESISQEQVAQKIQDKLQKLYPEIKLNITNKPIWKQGNGVFNQEEYNNQVNYRLKATEILLSDKAKQIFAKGEKAKWDLNKILTELAIPKEQKQLLLDLGITDREQLALELASKYNYSVEINTAIIDEKESEAEQELLDTIENTALPVDIREEAQYELQKYYKDNKIGKPTSYYSNLTVPGGTNYTENEISTPLITPSIKGHAQFATDKGIGWARVDEQVNGGEIKVPINNGLGGFNIQNKTLRVLEIQSDVFQKGRDKEDLINRKLSEDDIMRQNISSFIYNNSSYNTEVKMAEWDGYEFPNPVFTKDGKEITSAEYNNAYNSKYNKNNTQNQFLQLLNKDSNWVTFFIKSIIQDSAKKGYERVLFPKGETAAKIEGHETIADEIESINNKINELSQLKSIDAYSIISAGSIYQPSAQYNDDYNEELKKKKEQYKDKYIIVDKSIGEDGRVYGVNLPQSLNGITLYSSEDEARTEAKKKGTFNNNKIKELEDRKANLKSQGIEKLKPIEAFYEIKVGNILEKQFGKENVKTITDEYGNQWREIIINQARDLDNILLQKNEANKIIGQANINALEILIDAVNQKKDTIPHEYAHFYIAWNRNSPIVQEAIKKWGSEESLVQAIGEQSVVQKGEAWNWWKKFVNWLLGDLSKLSKLDKEQLKNILTDAFLTRQDLANLEQQSTEPSISQLDTRKRLFDQPKVKLFKLGKRPKKPAKLTRNTHYLLKRIPDQTRPVYIDGYPKGSNKRTIASAFFRYETKAGDKEENSWPMYPFTLAGLDNVKNNQYADFINSHFDRRVVGVNEKSDNGIEFSPDVENAKYVGSDLSFDDKEFDKPIEEESKSETKIEYDEAISLIEKKIALLNRRIQKTGGNPNMRANLASYEAQIKKIKSEKVNQVFPTIIEDIAKQDAKVVKDAFVVIRSNINILKDSSPEQILNVIESLNQASYTIKGWINVQDYVSHENPELNKKLGDINWEYIQLNQEYCDLLVELYTEYANRNTTKSDYSKDDILKAVEDFKYAKFAEIGSSDIAMLRITDDLITQAEIETNLELANKEAEVANWEDKLKKAGHSRDSIIEMLKQKHNGKWTGNTVGTIKHEYYLERDKMRKDGKPAAYFNWLNENSKRVLVRSKDGKIILYREASEKLGYTKEELDYQEELIKEYISDKKAYEETLRIRFDDEVFIQQELESWIKENSPVLYSNNWMNKGDKYLIPEKPNVEKWGDKDFEKLPQIVKDFRQFMVNRFNENNKLIGHSNQYDENYLPEQESTFLEQLTKSNVSKKNFVWNKLKTVFVREVQDIEDSRILIGNTEIKSIPISMMDDKIHPSMKDADVFNILNAHTKMAIGYKHKTKIEPMTNASQYFLDIVKEIELVDTGTDGAKERRNFGTISKKKDQLNNAKRALRYFLDKQMYSTGKKVEGRMGKTIEVEEYVKGPIWVEEDVINEETGLLEKKWIKKGEPGEMMLVKKKTNVTVDRLVDFLIGWTYTKTMAFPNFMSPVVNATFGANSILSYAARKQDFAETEALKAIMKMTTVTSKTFGGLANPELVNKTYAFINMFGLFGKIHDTDFIKKKTIQEKILIMQEKAEIFVQGATMIATLEGVKLKDKNGNTASAFEAFKYKDGKLVWDVEKMGEKTDVANDKLYSDDLHGINLTNLARKVNEVNKMVSGNYKDPMMAKEEAAMRLIMMYKTWIPRAIDSRFGRERQNKNLEDKFGRMGRIVKGRYRSVYQSKTQEGIDVGVIEAIGMILKEFAFYKSFDKLSEVDAANMRANLMEIRQVVAIYILIAVMKAAFMDDDDEAKPALNLAINTLTKAGADLSFFLSPFSLQQVTSNIIPVTSTLTDIQRAILNVNGVNTLKLLPLGNSAVRMYRLGERPVTYY